MTAVNPTALERSPATGRLNSSFHISDYRYITASGIGTKSNDVAFEDFESLPVGAISGSAGILNISNPSGVAITTAQAWTGTKSLVCNFAGNDFPKIYRTFAGLTQKLYYSCRLRIETTAPSANTNVWKLGRVTNDPTDPYRNLPNTGNVWTTQYTSQIGDVKPRAYSSATGIDTVTGTAGKVTGSGSMSDIVTDSFMFYQIDFDAGTVNGADCYAEESFDLKSITKNINFSFRTTMFPQLVPHAMTPICGLDGTNTTKMYIDEFYITASRARVVLTDNATYANSTKSKIFAQPDLAGGWSNEGVYITPRWGTFISGETAYYHIFNDSGVLSNTQSVVVP